ncbi:potassium channel family protein [Mariniplasma anaerobium]|uniref:Potassium transporter TrkA n=1 Tax=Mariniplasma anaerobium TaxID=2735436 RepID=A0A7U9XUP9_9MOLU|nr:potassium channel protein [Mariniplasma anaerobium]BCR36255.1 potassium transporter TrkA [Mariniplasma anaerobium]
MKIKKIVLWGLIMITIIFGAAIGYTLILDVPFVDGLYMTIITISTVGYGEVALMTPLAKLFSIIFIIISVGMVGYLVKASFDFFGENNFNQTWRRKKMLKEINKLKDHIIICGGGETGINVIKQMMKRDVDIVVVDNDEKIIETLKELKCPHIFDDATKEEVLIQAGLKEAKGIITTLSTDADNVFVVLTAKQLNPNIHIISRFHESSAEKKLIHAGANQTVSPDEIGGKKMAALMISPHVQYFVDNIIDTKNMSIDMEEVLIKETSGLVNKKLRDTKISEKAGLIVLALRRDEDIFIFNPKADEVLRANDNMIVVGSKEQIEKLKQMSLDVD